MRTQTVKQSAWVEAMLTGVNPTEAARIAKYAPNTHKYRGYENTTKSYLMTLINKRREQLVAETGFTVAQAQQMYQEDRAFAQECKQAGAATSATTGICRLYGMDRDVNLNLNADIPTEPEQYKSWLRKELARIEGSNEVIDNYAKSEPAIAKRH